MNNISQERWEWLFRQYTAGQATEEEERELYEWSLLPDNEDRMEALLHSYWQEIRPEQDLQQEKADMMLNSILHPANTPVRSITGRWRWRQLAIAAAVLIVVAAGIYLWTKPGNNQLPSVTQGVPVNVQPGSNGAILTLADGSTLQLDSLPNGLVATQSGTQVSLHDGGLNYDPAAADKTETYNTIATPHGRQFQVALADGTKVWLNAGSSIRFPTAFGGQQRKVEITGEAFLEVKKNARKPFLVEVKERNTTIEVLGTSFNVSAYNNEQVMSTTLIDGIVRINETQLTPGQQAQMKNGKLTVVSNHVNIEKIIAWKNGVFNFEGSTIGEVMRQLERWYDIKVDYSKASTEFRFRGGMYRNVNLADVLEVMKEMGIRYEWNGKVLTVF